MTDTMTRDDIAVLIIKGKKDAGLTWEALAEKIGMSPVWTHAVATGMATAPTDKAALFGELFDLPAEAVELLQEPPTKNWSRDIPTDPCIYRLYEIAGVYGPTFKTLVQEKFGDGIMSAIDFDMFIDKIEDPKGDRVKLTMTGKFLPYKLW